MTNIYIRPKAIKSNSLSLDTLIGGRDLFNLKNITYNQLVTLRNQNQLVPGQQYRITDYVTTTTQENTQSAGHQFDVIVLALTENELCEEAYAAINEGDTYFTEAKANLSAWKLWYCLDNNTERFAWADEVNGKGVIYRMIDEWNNDIPYDFKNIQFVRQINLDAGYPKFSNNEEETWVYTFCATSYHINNNEWSGLKDGSLESPYGHMSDENTSTFHHNSMKPWIVYYYGNNIYSECGKAYLNDNVFLGYWEEIGSGNEEDMPYYIANGCYSNTFGNDCHSNSFGNSCHSNTFGNSCHSNNFGNYCCSNRFGNDCDHNSFGTSTSDLKSHYRYITIENGNRFINLNCTSTTGSNNFYQNVRIGLGVNNTTTSKTIDDPNVGQTYETYYKPVSSQTITV